MKKKIAVLTATVLAAALAFAWTCPNAAAKETKIGYADLLKIFEEFSKTKELEGSLSQKGKIKEEERTKLVSEIRRMKDELVLLSDKAKTEKQGLIDTKIKDLQTFDQTARDDLLKQRNDMIDELMKDIEKIVGDYAKEAGYDVILNARTLLYGGKEIDITEEILKRLNKK